MAGDTTAVIYGDRIDATVRVVDLRIGRNGSGAFSGRPAPSLAWRLAADRNDVAYIAYELSVAADASFDRGAVATGRLEGGMVMSQWPTSPLGSRDVRWVRCRAWTDHGVTEWSDPLRIEAALLEDADWVARPISPLSNVGRADPGPVPILRRSFTIDRPVASARLYATALGVHETWVNGRIVGDALLEPGWTAYERRLHYAVHDVADLLETGENVLAAEVGDGWWRGWLTWMGKRAVYGSTTAFLAQLEVVYEDGTVLTVATDDTWMGSTGSLVSADLYDGSVVDFSLERSGWREPGFDASDWEGVAVLPLPAGLVLRGMPPVRVVDSWSIEPRDLGEGLLAVDVGQNLAGFLRITVRGPAGAVVSVRHAEVLDADDRLYRAPLRAAKATDTYALADERSVELSPSFTYHGFRYAEIQSDPDVVVEAVEACAISSDLEQIGRFECSDDRVNQLFRNVRWSQVGNMVSLPTDCPQRDERMGWTGDIQVFAETACLNADATDFLSSWLVDLALEQRADGCVPSTVPNVVPGFEYEYGGVGWGDAATLVPWDVYVASGDVSVLADQYASMRAWIEWCASRRNPEGTWTGDFHLGDWLDPGAPADEPHKATTDRDLIATAYLARSARVLAATATLLDRPADRERYAGMSAEVAAAAWRRWGDVAAATQAGAAIFLQFGIVPASEARALGRALADLVDAGGGRIATGFLGTPAVLPALSDAGEIDAAYRLLLNEECPGWLYQVARGATTMWERWDAVREDGSLHTGDMAMEEGASMISFNHYAYGAVASWLYRTVAGIRLVEQEPGYRRIVFSPQPGGNLKHASASILSPYGLVGSAWRIGAEDGDLTLELQVPPGSRARLDAPAGWQRADPSVEGWEFGSGTHLVSLLSETKVRGL